VITYFLVAQLEPKSIEMFQVLPAQLDPLCAFGFLASPLLNLVVAISKEMLVKRLAKAGWHRIENQHKQPQLEKPGFLDKHSGLAIAALQKIS
jgi:hypothetical protein